MNHFPHTAVEFHTVPDGRQILVKREDLSCPYPGPSFSKIRGVYEHIRARPERMIGVLDTFHSKAGWAVSYCCELLGKEAINFWPEYKADKDRAARDYNPPLPAPLLRQQQIEAMRLGARLISLPAGRSAVLYHQAKKTLNELATLADCGAYLMPNALKLPETVRETADETRLTLHNSLYASSAQNVVISVSSGTIAAGVLQGFFAVEPRPTPPTFHLNMGYDRSEKALLDYIGEVSGLDERFPSWRQYVRVTNAGYGYKDKYKGPHVAPFPCNPHYDAKAWGWLMDNPQIDAVLFWNVGE